MNNVEREQSGCPFRRCLDDGDHCDATTFFEDVTGCEMCEYDWESCPDYENITKEH